MTPSTTSTARTSWGTGKLSPSCHEHSCHSCCLRVTCELAKGTPHGRDKDRWGGGGYGRRSRSRSRDGRGGGGRENRPVWLEKYGPPTRTEYRVIVENLSSRVSWQDLKDFMRSAGEVTYADAHKTQRNEGVVEFARYDIVIFNIMIRIIFRYDDVLNAIEKLDDTELNGRRIKIVDDSRKKGSRSRSRSRRTRSRTRSRSGRGRSRSRTGSRKGSRSRSRSGSRRSGSPKRDDKSRSKSRSKSKSPAKEKSRSRSRSKSRGSGVSGGGDREMKSRSRSRSRSTSQ